MAVGNILAGTARKDAANAYVTIAVGGVEFNCSTPLLKADGSSKSAAELKAELVLDARRQLDAQTNTVTTLAGVSGSVTV